MVTAGHCATYALNEGVFSSSLDLTVDGHRAVGWRIHPKYAAKAQDMRAYDVAVVQFGADASFPTSELAAADLNVGEPVVIVGYGESQGVAGIKRMGRNVVKQLMFGQYLLTSDPNDLGEIATGTEGDSGGPLFNAEGKLNGVTAEKLQQPMLRQSEFVEMGAYISTTEPEIRQFIDKSVAELAKSNGRAGH